MRLSKIGLIVGVGIISLGATCPIQPPKPTPTPTPTPTPEPPAGLDNNRTLRTKGTSLTLLDGTPFHFDLAIQCCDAIPGVDNSRWPLISPPAIDYYKKYDLNAVAYRIGPFYGVPGEEDEWVGIGGAYTGVPPQVTLTWNDQFRDAVLAITQHAYDNNFWILVNIIDTWRCKHASKKQGYNDVVMPWPQSDIDACGIKMTDVQEQYIRYWVKVLGKYPNIIWHTDIEGSLIMGSNCSEWWTPQYNIIRDEEKKNSYPVHLIGTNNEGCSQGPFEFVSTHKRAALLDSIAGKFTINDERNPAFPPDQEINNFKQARDLGLSYAYWRAGMSNEQSEVNLAGIKGVISGGTPIVGCYAPDSEDPLWDPNPLDRSQFQPDSTIKTAVNACRNTLGPMTGQGHDKMLISMAACLRESGFCSSKASDAVMTQRTDAKQKYEEYHMVSYVDDTWDTRDKVLPKTLWTYTGSVTTPDCHGAVGVTDRVACRMQQAYGLIDCTPLSHGQPIRPEGDPERVACERKSMEPLGGYPIFKLESSTLVLKTTTNPMQVIADKKGTGTLTCSFPKDLSNYCNPQTNGLPINKP